MLAKDLISEVVPAIRTSDTGMQALNWMEIFRISHLPIVNNKEFLGLISDADIYDLNAPEEPIGNHKLSLFSPYVTHNQHIYEVIEMVARLKLSVIPVLDEKKEYLGLITLHDLLQGFSKVTAVERQGSILVLEMNIRDYSLSQIAQIVESNNAKILSLYMSSSDDSMQVEVTLKINVNDLTSIVQTFNRYDYVVKGTFMDSDTMDSYYQSRYDSFMKYLNV